jgi:riboflavin kinase
MMIERIRINNNSKWDQLYAKESYLEKPYILSSEIIRGFKRGSTELGFPTANLNLQSLLVTPFAYAEQATPSPLSSAESLAFIENLKTGVYVGCARIYNSESSPSINRIYPCVFSVGWNPTYNNSSKTVEVHLLDVDVSTTLPHKTDAIPADFYGEFLDVYSLVYLREEHKFSSIGIIHTRYCTYSSFKQLITLLISCVQMN